MDDLKSSMISRIAEKSTDEVRFRNQNRSEAELTYEEKEQILQDLLTKSPSQFLARFGLALELADLDYFNQYSSDPDIPYHLRNLRERLDANHRRTLIENRRYAKIPFLNNQGYFDEIQMQSRDPLLYEDLVEKYLDDAEKEDLKKLRIVRQKNSEEPIHPFADLLMETLIDNVEIEAFKAQQKEKEASQEEEVDSDEETAEEPEKPPAAVELDDRQKELFRQEFRHIMEERFLDGLDGKYIDYSEIDEDSGLDASEEVSRDKEEMYFEYDEEMPPVPRRFRLTEENVVDESLYDY